MNRIDRVETVLDSRVHLSVRRGVPFAVLNGYTTNNALEMCKRASRWISHSTYNYELPTDKGIVWTAARGDLILHPIQSGRSPSTLSTRFDPV